VQERIFVLLLVTKIFADFWKKIEMGAKGILGAREMMLHDKKLK
jgi:hypothetical protein